MQKRKKYLGVVIIGLVLSILWIFNRTETLGNITQSFKEPTTSTSTISFSGEADESIELSFKSNVMSGELNIALCDSDGNMVYGLDKESTFETCVILDKTDIYTLKAEHVAFAGSYDIHLYKVN